MKKPRVVRRVLKMSRTDGLPKIARDFKANITIERVKAQSPRICHKKFCIFKDHTIELGEYYFKLYSGQKTGPQYRQWPLVYDLHYQCLPDEAKYLKRFFMVPASRTSKKDS